MNPRLNALRKQIRLLEDELVLETGKGETRLFQIEGRKIGFTDATKARHKELRIASHQYLLSSTAPVLLTIPFVWICLIPVVFADLVFSFYQAVCFPIYGIPKVIRGDYFAYDRHRLGYLNFIEKLNCEYCAYGNGALAYFMEIASRTEQHWCPIKHAGCDKCSGSRTRKFLEFGDAESYRKKIEDVRSDYDDLNPE